MNFHKLEQFLLHLTDSIAPGNSIRVYQNNQVVFEHSTGFADSEHQIPMRGDELLYLYSCSKIATVTAALQLYEQGRFSLEDPLYQYFPEYRNMKVRNPDGSLTDASSPITIRNLFTMTAGFSYDFGLPCYETARQRTGGKMNTTEVIRCLAREPLLFQPGSRFEYSVCLDVLAGVVEVISEEKFRDYVKKHIFEPLEIEGYYHKTPETERRMAQQYICKSNETDIVKLQQAKNTGIIENYGLTNPHILGEEYDSGGAGIITSVKDYAKLASALSMGGIGPNGVRILRPETVNLMKTNQLSRYHIASIGWSHLQGYGYGLGVRTLVDRNLANSPGNLGEFGWGGAAGATVLCDCEAKAAFVYAHHMLNPQEAYYQPLLRNVFYACLND